MILTLMSQRSYNRLPADLKAVIDADSGAPLSARLGEIWDSQTAPAIEATRSSAGNEIIDIPDSEKARWRTAVQPVYDAWIAEMNRRGRNGRAMFEDIQAIAATPRRS
jgi:TRAP-type C4-dicarboxylate transport system substrate-binding protein